MLVHSVKLETQSYEKRTSIKFNLSLLWNIEFSSTTSSADSIGVMIETFSEILIEADAKD